MNTFTKLTAAVALTGLCALTACSHEPKDSKEAAEEMNDNKFSKDDQKDADCVVNAYSANLFEIKTSENATLNAGNTSVKTLANLLIEKHTQMNQEIKALAEKKQISLPADLTEEQRRHIEKLTEKNGLDYDKAYVQLMKEKHERAVKDYEKDASDCVDNDIRQWAIQALPELRSHLDRIDMTWNEIKDLK